MRTRSFGLALAIVLLCPCAGAQWVRTAYDSGLVSCFAVNGTNLFASTWTNEFGWTKGVFRSTNGGTSWTSTGFPTEYAISLVYSDPNLVAGSWIGVFLSTNNGVDWLNTGLKLGSAALCFSTSATNLVAGTYGAGFAYSTNNGASWTVNRIQSKGDWENVTAVEVTGTRILAGGDYGPRMCDMCPNDGFFLSISTDNGANWNTSDFPTPYSEVGSVAFVGTNLLASTNDGVLLSTDQGTSWSAASTPFSGFAEIIQIGSGHIAATYDGVFVSTDDGTSWTTVNEGLSNTNVSALTVCGTYLFAGTFGSGVWRRPLSEIITSVEPITEELPHEFLLQQNYPNPFNPATKIQFTIGNRQLTIVKVFDLLGREVTTLVNEVKSPGTYTVDFDARLAGGQGSNLASGVYFYRLQAGDFTQTKRLMLLR